MIIPPNFSLKKAAVLAIGLTTPTCMFAATHGSWNGPYAGVAAGAMRTNSSISTFSSSVYSNVTGFPNTLASQQDHVHLYKDTAVGDVFLGYGHLLGAKGFYLAGEIFGNWATRSNTLNNLAYHDYNINFDLESLNSSTTLATRNSEFGIDARPGFLLGDNTMVYGRVGVAFNRLTNTTNNTFNFVQGSFLGPLHPPGAILSTMVQTNHHHTAALRLGLGLEQKITDMMSLTLDYIYTYYGNVKTSGIASTVTVGGEDVPFVFNENGLTSHTSGNLSTQSIMLGIRYYFLPC